MNNKIFYRLNFSSNILIWVWFQLRRLVFKTNEIVPVDKFQHSYWCHYCLPTHVHARDSSVSRCENVNNKFTENLKIFLLIYKKLIILHAVQKNRYFSLIMWA